MAHGGRRSRQTSTLLTAAALAAATGCAPTKTVTIDSSPTGATLTLYKVPGSGGPEQRVPLEGNRAPVTTALTFDEGAHYRVEAHKELCAPSGDTTVTLDPTSMTDYTVPLTRFKAYVDDVAFVPVQAMGLWQLRPQQARTVATLDDAEPATSANVDQLTNLTRNRSDEVSYPSFTVSPTTGTVVFEEVRRDTAAPQGYVTRLYQFRPASGQAPTVMGVDQRQQHYPSFDPSGETIVYDCSDDRRTDGPFEMKTTDNGAQPTKLQADQEVLSYEFSANNGNLAFVSYGPNADQPKVEIAGRDGTAPSQRAVGGIEPQLSPDGTQILYAHKPNNVNSQFYRLESVPTRGQPNARRVLSEDGHDVRDGHWSPDGQLIAYRTDKRDGPPADLPREPDVQFREPDAQHSFVWVATADGRARVQVTRNESYDASPVFDRDGRTIYFRSNRGGHWNLWRCRLSDTAMATLAAPRAAGQ